MKLQVGLAIAISLSTALPALSQMGTVTIFRENHRNNLVNLHATGDADKAKMLTVQILMDGAALTKLSSGSFVTFKIPSGKHSFAIKPKLGEGELSVDVPVDGHVYLRPTLNYHMGHLAIKAELQPIACKEALELLSATEPIKNKEINGSVTATQDIRPPAECVGVQSSGSTNKAAPLAEPGTGSPGTLPRTHD